MQNHIKILVVDDERIAVKNLEHILKKEGYSVTGTESASNALKLLEKQAVLRCSYRPEDGKDRRYADT